jgi:predicted NACHT family NTPase
MSEQVYSWKRFWCPRSGSINLADGGYLCDPSSEWGKYYNLDLVSLEAIADIPCLVLLGEPGIGKSQEMENLKKYTEETIAQPHEVLQLNLRSCNSLMDELFKDETFLAWIDSTNSLYLFLDSLDEGLLGVPNLATQLVDNFSKKKYRERLNRLYLRIACRTAVFPEILEKGLEELWGKNSVGVYELAPLRRVDVMEAAKAEGFSPDDFLKEIGQKDIVPLAIKPVTLGFLLNSYRRHNGQFLSNQRLHELYLEGCKLLCEEVNPSRRASNRKGNIEIDQRLIVAAQIAAITILTNRFAVWTGIDRGDVPAEDVILQKLCHGYENANGRQFEITRVVIEEVLDTGLFSSRGLHRMGWAHQTYAEFLAAWYLVQHEIPLTQITELIFSFEDPDRKLIPQLHETAAWLASIRADVLQEIIKTDPDVLLRSDIPTNADVRASIVDNLLLQYEQEKLFDRNLDNYRHYAKLNHFGIADQLRPYICDPNKQIDARDLAIDIAEVCQVNELQQELVNLALDSSQSIYLRVSAAKAICSVGDLDTRLKLKPLAVRQLPEDEDDRLKGYILQALWSAHLTAEELFQALTLPKKLNFFGVYQMFFKYYLTPQLQPNDLVFALSWIEKQGMRCFGHPFEELANAILIKAWEHFDLPGVAESFTKVALVQWREHQIIITHNNKLQEQFASSLLNDSKKRHTLIEQAVSIISKTEEESRFLLSSLSTEKVLLQEDVFWILERLHNYDCEKAQKIWFQLFQCSFNRQDAKQIDAIITAIQNDNILQKFFAPYFEPIKLDSIQAEKLRADYLRMQEMQEYRQNSRLLYPPPRERVIQLLEKLEAGELSAWWGLNRAMTLNPESKYYDNELELDLTKLPGWQEADEVTRKRIIEGAKKYIQQQNDIPYDWIGTNTDNRAALAGCRALHLLLKESSDFLNTLSPEICRKWTPVILADPCDNQYKNSFMEILKRSYLNAPQVFINTLITLIDKDNHEHEYLFGINRLDKCWDKRLKLALLEKAKDPSLKPQCVGQLLEELLKQELTEARDYAKSLIYFPLPLVENEREKALIASRVLVENSDPSSWSLLWSLIQQDSSFGREVLELAANRYSFGIQLNLTETQLADLYLWLVQQYPYDEDLDYSNEVLAHFVTVREGMANLRDNVLSQLKERGTLQACTEIQRLIQKLPHIAWLRKMLIDAQANMRRKTWQPPQPEQILQIVGDLKRHLVQNGQQLLDVLLESLKRLELELQGETPAVRDLWDKVDDNKFKPVDENAFSDYVKRFLDKDLKSRGIIVNREVELRRNYGGSSGERTDIHVDAVVKKPNGELYDCITVIIEVKGCWHKDLNSAMKEQLVQRYLQDNSSKYGLYLVGWFKCNQWDDKDSRKGKAPKISIDQIREQFDRQAEQLSSPPNVVRAYVLNTALR